MIILIVAIMYSMVGHGGASGYIAAMALFAMPIGEIKFYALCMNLLVSAITFWSFFTAGHFKFKLLWPFVIASIPAAYLGSLISINLHVLQIAIAIVLVISSIQLIREKRNNDFKEINKVPMKKALPIGGVIGLLSGLLGIGGGIILSPVLIHMRWANAKNTAATSAAFIFLNSLAGIFGQVKMGHHFTTELYIYLLVALLGALIGSNIGSKKISIYKLKVALSIVLLIAAAKLMI